MKTLKTLLCCGVAMLNFSCQPKENAVDRPYFLFLSFLDADGNDLVEGIGRHEPDGSVDSGLVDAGQYTLTSSPDLDELWPNEGSFWGDMGYVPVELADPHPYPRLHLGSQADMNMMSSSYCLLYIGMSSAPWYDRHLGKITYTLTCPHVFGDDDPHEIVTYWRSPSNNYDWYGVCYRVVVDGREFTDISYTSNSEQISLATIVLDR